MALLRHTRNFHTVLTILDFSVMTWRHELCWCWERPGRRAPSFPTLLLQLLLTDWTACCRVTVTLVARVFCSTAVQRQLHYHSSAPPSRAADVAAAFLKKKGFTHGAWLKPRREESESIVNIPNPHSRPSRRFGVSAPPPLEQNCSRYISSPLSLFSSQCKEPSVWYTPCPSAVTQALVKRAALVAQ